MAIIRKALPSGKNGDTYVKYDPRIFLIKGLSDGAKVLYGYMSSMRNGSDFSDIFFMRGLSLSETAYRRRKKELVEVGLLLVDRVGLKQYIMYIGFIGFKAEAVRTMWLKQETENQEAIPISELKITKSKD